MKNQKTGASTVANLPSLSTDQSLQKSFYLSPANKIELKKISFPSENKKYATAQTNTIEIMTVKCKNGNGLQQRSDRRPTGNSTYKKLAVQLLNEALCFISSSMVADSFRLPNRQLLVDAKCNALFLKKKPL